MRTVVMLTRSLRQFQLAALAIVLLTVGIRLPALLHPQAIDDEAVYSVVANEMVDGGRPYVDAIERKPPLLFWTYAAVFKIAGKYNWTALHIVAVCWTLGTMAGLYVIARRLFDRETGLVAALLYSIFQPVSSWKNLGFNGELMMNLPLVWGWAIAFGHRFSNGWFKYIAAGVLLSLGFLLKQPGAIAAVPLGLYLLLSDWRGRESGPASFARAGLLTAGFFGTLAFVAGVLRRQGILAEAVYWTIGDHTVPHFFWDRAIHSTLIFAGVCLPLLLGATLSAWAAGSFWADKKAERNALLCLTIASAIGVAAGGRFYSHYYIQLLPALTLLAAPFYTRLFFARIPPRFSMLGRRVTATWLALVVVGFSIARWWELASIRSPSEAGRFLLEHSAPDEKIFVWGEAAKIYVEAQRRPACRYILTFPLTGYLFGGPLPGFDTRSRILPGAWPNLLADFKKHPPTYIVDTQFEAGALDRVRDFPILAQLLAEHYEPVAQTPDALVYRLR
ncbi:MAG TPA: glycosyltransferase family 39 protein [Chthoniobacterales bacterium]|nr:glycosyltransferase family 39 protein [Chthoniobacterales bacterium]